MASIATMASIASMVAMATVDTIMAIHLHFLIAQHSPLIVLDAIIALETTYFTVSNIVFMQTEILI